MYYAVWSVLFLCAGQCHAKLISNNQHLEEVSSKRLSFTDYRNQEKVLEFEGADTDKPSLIYHNKIDIPTLAKNFITTLSMYVPTTNSYTSYYQNSLSNIENYFVDIHLLLRTKKPSQTNQIIKNSINIDIAASRFITEMGGYHIKVQNWQFLRNMES